MPPSSPLARQKARDLGLDLRALRGSGPGGRILLRDVEAAPRSEGMAELPGLSAAIPRADRRVALSGKRSVIARRLSESFFTSPHYYLKRRVMMERLLDLRSAVNAGSDRPLSFNAFLLKICAAALERHPQVNASWEGDAILEHGAIDIALAVALPDGLVTPVVRDCRSKGVAAIDGELGALIERARGRGLKPEEFEGATFTISNLGSFGVEEFTAIINPPASAILAVGAVRSEPVALEGGVLAARPVMALTLGCDHRVIDGAVGAAFLSTLAQLLEEPGRVIV